MTKKIIIALTLIATATCLAQQPKTKPAPTTAASGTIVLRGGKLLTISHGVIENGVLVMHNGRIVSVGPASTQIPNDATVIDVTRMPVYPGLTHSQTHLA